MKTLSIEYRDEQTLLEGFCAYDEKILTKKPAILIAHDWSGKNKFAEEKAERIAELGYVGFAIDVFGKGVKGSSKEEKSDLIKPFMQDRAKLRQRLLAAYDVVCNLEPVDAERIGAIGFCFGGLCVLDLARSGANAKGVVSFHGLLGAPDGLPEEKIKAKVLALHGYDDPMATPDQVMEFANEMTYAKVDWEINLYGHTKHAFTNPEANDPDFGTVYNKRAESRSWIAMQEFFREIF